MTSIHRSLLAGVGVAAMLAAAPAFAQKAKDNVRIALHQPMGVVDGIYDPRPESGLITYMVFDTLISYDAVKQKYVSNLAESWKRIDPVTMEFKLRKDVKFQNGSPFDADDIVYSLEFGMNPKNNFRFKGSRFGWIKEVRKLDQYTIQIVAKGASFAPFLARLVSQPPTLPSDYHSSFKNPQDFGKRPIGTGNFKVVSVDATKGVVLEKVPYVQASSAKPAAQVSRIHLIQVPERQTQIAKVVTGELDLIYNVDSEQAEAIRNQPGLAVTVVPTISFSYIYFDSSDRSGIHILKDRRVREALLHAIDRKALEKALLPKEAQNEPLQNAMCHPWHIGCVSSLKAPNYDPAKAKAMLKEAGAEHFKLELSTWGAATKTAEAVAGMLRKVGVEASVDRLTFGGYNKKRNASKVQTFVSLWDNAGGQPDINNTAGFYWRKGILNYIGDDTLHNLYLEGNAELDPAKRNAIYREGFDRIIKESYQMPLLPIPAVVVHNKDLEIQGGHKSPKGFELNRIRWK